MRASHYVAGASIALIGAFSLAFTGRKPPRVIQHARRPGTFSSFTIAPERRAGLPLAMPKPGFSVGDLALTTVCCDRISGSWIESPVARSTGQFSLGGKTYTMDFDAVVPGPHHFAPDGTPIVRRSFGGLPGAGVIPNDRPDNLGKTSLLETDEKGRQYWSTSPVEGVFVLVYDPDPGSDFTGSVDWGEYLQAVAATIATVASFVPGIGTSVALVVAGAAALARGASLSDAFIAGVRASLPGGPAAAAAFDVAYGLARGESISQASMDAIRNQVPPEARGSFDAAVAVLNGKNLKEAAEQAALQTIHDQIPAGPARDAFDASIAIAKGRKIQEVVASKIASNLPDGPTRELAWRMGNGQKIQDAALAVGGQALYDQAFKSLGSA